MHVWCRTCHVNPRLHRVPTPPPSSLPFSPNKRRLSTSAESGPSSQPLPYQGDRKRTSESPEPVRVKREGRRRRRRGQTFLSRFTSIVDSRRMEKGPKTIVSEPVFPDSRGPVGIRGNSGSSGDLVPRLTEPRKEWRLYQRTSGVRPTK